MNTISEIFQFSESKSISIKNLHHPDMHHIIRDIFNLFNSLGDGIYDSNILSLTRQLKKLRFELSAAPLSKEYFSKKIDDLIISLSEKEAYSGYVYPQSKPFFTSLSQDFIVFQDSNLNLLQEEIIRLIADEPKIHFAILLKDTRLIPIAEEEFQNLLSGSNYSFLSQDALRSNQIFQNLVVVGPFNWYNDYVFSAPRAKEIFVFKYSFIRGSWKYHQPFIAPVRYKRAQRQPNFDEEEVDGLDADLLLPFASIETFYQKALDEIKKTNIEEEYSEAYLYVLEGDNVVFLEVDGSSQLIIDIDENGDFYGLDRIEVRDITKGMFLLLRTEGGGDYIKPIADNILGSKAGELREAQKRWKEWLRSEIKKYGFNRSIAILHENGCDIVSAMNLRNWLRENSISTQRYNHFEAIFRFFNKESEAKSYWNMMKTIKNAHARAGHSIRRMLLEKVKKSDLKELVNSGIMEFSLEGEHSASLTAFRVLNYARDKKFTVAPWRIGTPMKFDEESWL